MHISHLHSAQCIDAHCTLFRSHSAHCALCTVPSAPIGSCTVISPQDAFPSKQLCTALHWVALHCHWVDLDNAKQFSAPFHCNAIFCCARLYISMHMHIHWSILQCIWNVPFALIQFPGLCCIAWLQIQSHTNYEKRPDLVHHSATKSKGTPCICLLIDQIGTMTSQSIAILRQK